MRAEVQEVVVVQPPPVVVLTLSREEAQAIQSTFANWGLKMVSQFANEGNEYLSQEAKIYYPLYEALCAAGIHPKYTREG